jgi:hypothetical protein
MPRRSLFLILPLLLALAACGSPTEQVKAPPSSFIQLAPVQPPINRYEDPVTPANPMTEVWRKGYWTYDGSEFRWNAGRLISRPSPTAVWCPDRWYQHTYGWGFVPGHWM